MALLAEAFVKVRPDFTGFGRELSKQLLAQIPVATAAGAKVGDAWAASFRRSLGQIKRDLQNVGVADFLDINIPPSKLYSQALILKRVLQRAGLSDILGVNLSVSQVTEQIGKLAKESLDIPVGFDVGKLPKIPGLKEITEQFSIIGIGTAQQQLADFDNSLRRLDEAAKAAAVGLTPFEYSMRGLGTSVDDVVASVGAADFEWKKFTPDIAAAGAAATAAAGKAGGGTTGGGGTGLAGMAGAAAGAAGGARLFRAGLGATIGGVALWHVALDGVLEALISVTSALTVLGIGISAVAPTFQDIATQMQNVKAIQDAMGVSLKPLTGQWQALQQALAPQAIEIFGGALNALTGQSGIFANTAHQVVTMFDDWIARIDLWVKGNKTMQGFLQSGVVYLGQFAKIIGTLTEAFANLLTKDPGIAHFLLDIIQGAASVLNWFSKLPGALVTLTIALHGAYVWGGALAGVFARFLIASPLGAIAKSMGLLTTQTVLLADGTKQVTRAFLGLKAFQWGFLAVIGAGLGYLLSQANQAQPSIQKLITTLQQNLTSLPASQEIPQIAADIGTLNAKFQQLYSSGNIAKVAQQIEHVGPVLQGVGYGLQGMWSSFTNIFTSRSFSDVGRALNNLFTPGGNAGQAARQAIAQDAKAISAAIDGLYGGYKNLATEAGNLMGWHDKLSMSLTRTGDRITSTSVASKTYQQALLEMDLAGVKWNDTVAVMQQKIANLETGYANLGISGTLFTNTLDAMNFASLQSQSNITKVTGGFDAFFKMISSGESGFSSFVSSLDTFQTSAKTAGSSLAGLNPQSITLRQNFLAAAQAAQTEMDNLMTLGSAAGVSAGTTALMAQSAKDMIFPLLGAAKGSAGLTQVLIALATQGGAQNITNFQQLAHWVGNVKDPMKNLDKNVTTLTVDAGNLTKDVQNLSTALGTTLNGAMATAIFDASGGQAAFTNFAQSVLHTKFNSDDMRDSARALSNELITTTGSTSRAHDMFVTFAMAGLHLTKQQADLLWQESLPNLQTAINDLHGKQLLIEAVLAGTGNVTIRGSDGKLYQISAGAYFSPHAAGGTIASGLPFMGAAGDDVLISAKKGEAIIPVSKVPMLAPALGAAGIPGFATGGLVGRFGGAGAMAETATVFGNLTATAVFNATSTAVSAAVAAARAAAALAASLETPGVATVARYAMLHGASRAAAAGIGGVVAGESGGDPEAIQAGGGGMGILQWTPGSSAFPLQPIITGNVARDMGVQLVDMLAYIASRGGMGQLNSAGAIGPMLAAWEFSAMEAPAVPGSDIRPSVVASLYAQGLDRGGMLKPGLSLAWNGTGRSEVIAPSGLDQLIGAVQDNTDAIVSAIEDLQAVTAAAPQQTGGSLGSVLNGVSRSAGYSALYNTRP